MAQTREKFATQVDSELLTAVRSLSVAEGRQIQTLVDEAFADLLEKRKKARDKRAARKPPPAPLVPAIPAEWRRIF